MKNKNIDTLSDFMLYCQKHPNERFWQALCNWCNCRRISIQSLANMNEDIDTFYFEGKDK
jgi:hypothetical protein